MHDKLIVVLDSNEFISGIRGTKLSSTTLIDNLEELNYNFRISQDLFEEIIRNIPNYAKKRIYNPLKNWNY